MYTVYETDDLRLFRFVIFRRCLEAEVKDVTRERVSLETSKQK